MKKAVYADMVYYNSKVHKNKYLIIEDELVNGILDEISPNDYDEVIRKDGCGIFPAFINTHTHLPMVYFRGLADDMPLMEWLQSHIWPAEGKWLSDEFVYDATMLAACEMIKSGTVCANDMYFFSRQIAKAISAAGLKGVIGAGVLDFPTKFAKDTEGYLNNAAELAEEFAADKNINIAICPHAPYTVSPQGYEKCIKFAEKYGIVIHTHLAETAWEIDETVKRYGKSPIQIFNEIGLLDVKSVLAHSIYLTEDEIDLLGRKKVVISHCLESNMKLASGFAPIKKLMDAGVLVSIGTDGAASNNDLDMLGEISSIAKVHKCLTGDPTVLPAETVLKMATLNGAQALCLENMGEIKKGNKADFIIVDFDSINMIPVYNYISQLVYSAKSENIIGMYVNGRCIMDDRKILSIDEGDVIDRAKYWKSRIAG